MFYFARCIRWRFGWLAPNLRAQLCLNVFAPLLLDDILLFTIYVCLFCLLVFGSLYVLCVYFYSRFLCSRGLNLSFLHRFSSVEYKFALLTLSFKNFYIQSHCLPTFFLLFLLWILRDFFLLNFSRVKITVTFALRAFGVASCKWIKLDSQIGALLLFWRRKNESLWKGLMEYGL